MPSLGPIQVSPQSIVVLGEYMMWTNMPAGPAENYAGYRTKADLTLFSQCRAVVSVATAGTAGSTITLQYSLDGSSGWTSLSGTATIAATGVKTSSWAAIPSAALTDVFVRWVGTGGNGADDPELLNIFLQVR